MSWESILDDAISEAKSEKHWQLVEWLRMARGSEKAARWYTRKLNELQAENNKLHVELTDLKLKVCPSCGIKVENEELLDRIDELQTEVDE